MKRIMAVVAVLGLVAGACGGGDDDADTDTTTEEAIGATETSSDSGGDESGADADTSADAATSAATDDTDSDGDDDGADVDGADDDGADDVGAGDDGADDDGGAAGSIRSISDIPDDCLDRMADFLREIEPIVSTIDWQTATFDEFEAIADEFEERSEAYEERFAESGCDDLDFADDSEFSLMIEFAEDEAPGTVSFLRFLDDLGAVAGGDGESDDGSATSDGFADCGEAISFVQDLLDTYDSFGEVPASELLKFAGLATIYITCSPDQLEFFDSSEVIDFLGG